LVSKNDVTAKLYLNKFYDEDKSTSIYNSIKESYYNANPTFDDYGKPVEKELPKAKLGEVFSGMMAPIFFISLVLAVAYKLCGSEAILNLKDSILNDAALEETSFFNTKNWLLYITIALTALVMFVVDSFGRKKILMIGIAGITLSSLLLSYAYDNQSFQITQENLPKLVQITKNPTMGNLKDQTFNDETEFKVALEEVLRSEKEVEKYAEEVIAETKSVDTSIMFYGLLGLLLFSIFAFVSMYKLIVSELFPNRIRSVAVGFMLFLVAVFGWFAYNFFDTFVNKFGAVYTFFAFALLGLLSFILTGFKFHETKQLTLEEIPNLFFGNNRKLKPRKVARERRERDVRTERKVIKERQNKPTLERRRVEKSQPIEEPEITTTKPKRSGKPFTGLDLDLD